MKPLEKFLVIFTPFSNSIIVVANKMCMESKDFDYLRCDILVLVTLYAYLKLDTICAIVTKK